MERTSVRVAAHGAAAVLSLAKGETTRALQAGEVRVRHRYAGINFIDTYYRSGLYPLPPHKALPYIPGDEGCGVVEESAAPEVAVGQRVAFSRAFEGSYTTASVQQAKDLYLVPEGVEDRLAAAVMLQGCTAHYLVHDCAEAKAGQTVLVHAAAGGTGLLLTQMLKSQGATVIGTCGGAAKAELAKDIGRCDHVIDTTAGEAADGVPAWVPAVKALAPGGVHAVVDGVGKATFAGGLAVLRPRGKMITFGNASGAVPAVEPLELTRRGSITLMRPKLGDYMDMASGEDKRRVAAVFALLQSNELRVHIGAELPLADAARAHELLESRQTTGKVLLRCGE